MKFCRDCKHRIPYQYDTALVHLSKCSMGRKDELPADYLVTAEGKKEDFEFCSTMRVRDTNRAGCGQEGVFWEPIKMFCADQQQGNSLKFDVSAPR